jgi:hypothetical protein
MTIDHTGIHVPEANYDEVVNFYLKALGPLGYTKRVEFPGAVGLGTSETETDFWIDSKAAEEPTGVQRGVGVHLGFRAKSGSYSPLCSDR